MRLLRGARRSIDAAIYEVGPSYRWALVRAAERGLRVRLVLDAHVSDGNAATARELIAAGGECRVAGVGADAAHGKLLIVDSTVAVGTGNLIWRDAPRDPHLRLPPQAPPLAGTREWWVTAARSGRLHAVPRWRRSTRIGPWRRRRRQRGRPRLSQARHIRRYPPSARRRHRCAPAGPLCSVSPAGTGDRRCGGRSGRWETMVAAARRRVLVTVPYARPEALPVRGPARRHGAGIGRVGVACALLIGGVPDPNDAAQLACAALPGPPHGPGAIDLGARQGHGGRRCRCWSPRRTGARPASAATGRPALRIDHPGAAAYYAAAWRRDWETGLAIDV